MTSSSRKDDIGNFVLIPQVVEAVSIPVIASGGIADGRGLMAALALGAEGIEMGTRFIATKECVHAHPLYKEAIVNGTELDTVIIKRSLGAPGRALRNNWTEKILEIERERGDYESLKDFISGEANKKYIYEGKIEEGYAWAGQSIGLVKNIPSVAELFDEIIEQAKEIRRKWSSIA
jgi:nitronate monooxygenase